MTIRVETFPAGDLFPANDALAIDLMRLMAAYNDLAFTVEWLEAHLTPPEGFNEQTWAAGRLDIQIRLVRSIMHETLKVIEDMKAQPGYSELEAKLDEEGRNALARLREVRTGQDRFSQLLLARTRDKTAYHYDHGLFKKAMGRLIERYSQSFDVRVLFIRNERSGLEQYYFPIADMTRVEMIGELTGEAKLQESEALISLTKSFGSFLQSLLITYAKEKGLSGDFRLK